MTRAGGDDQTVDTKEGDRRGRYGVVPDDCDVCTQEAEGLVEVPGEGVEVVDHEDVDGDGEVWWEGHAGRECREGNWRRRM